MPEVDPNDDPASGLSQELTKLVLRAERRSGRSVDRADLARRLNISVGSLYAYLKGTTVPRSPLFERLITALGASGSELGRLSSLRESAELSQRLRRHRSTGRAKRGTGRSTSIPQQLPSVTDNFVGRRYELAVLDKLLDEASTAAGTVVITAIDGTPGVGKTSLAVRWAHQVAEHYPDGQLYVNLRGFDSRALMATTEALHGFLVSLGVASDAIPGEQDAMSALLRTLLADRRVLLLLDNARSDHQVRPLLPAAPSCLVVITSRNRMDGLVVREGARRVLLDVMSKEEARAVLTGLLGVERVEESSRAADDLVELCAALPLALGIAAARVASRPTQSMAALVTELGDVRARLDFLGSDDPDVDLRSVFHWSYAALPPDGARLFRLLGTHPGPDADEDACTALLGVSTAPRQELSALVKANLVVERSPGRFGMHDLIRGYAEELADEHDTDERRAVTRRILDHYLDAANAADQQIQPGGATVRSTAPVPDALPSHYSDAMSWFTSTFPVLRAAIALAATSGFESHAWRLAHACTVFLRRSGRRADRVAVHRTGVDAALQAGDRRSYANELRLLADALARTGQRDDALDLLHTSLAESINLGDDDACRQAHLSFVRLLEGERTFEDALQHALRALHLARDKDLLAQADGLTAVSRQLCLLGEAEKALSFGTRAREFYIRLGQLEGEASILSTIGLAQQQLGHHGEAIASYERSVELDRILGDAYWEARALNGLADVYYLLDEQEEVRLLRAQALEILESLHHPDAEAVRRHMT
ncbi:tetratricopeptide repeat protein [Actinosynnema sp. NPDC050801]|uniref:ATP-binding protein n=1 Tax=unclassified Actinosynnema TaxID=2637065 RepID=UPI0033FD685C